MMRVGGGGGGTREAVAFKVLLLTNFINMQRLTPPPPALVTPFHSAWMQGEEEGSWRPQFPCIIPFIPIVRLVPFELCRFHILFFHVCIYFFYAKYFDNPTLLLPLRPSLALFGPSDTPASWSALPFCALFLNVLLVFFYFNQKKNKKNR